MLGSQECVTFTYSTLAIKLTMILGYIFNQASGTKASRLFFTNSAPWARVHTSTEEPVCTNQSVLVSSLPANCKVRNDRTFRKYKLELNSFMTSANTEPYISIEIRNTNGETVNVNLKLTVMPGETNNDNYESN